MSVPISQFIPPTPVKPFILVLFFIAVVFHLTLLSQLILGEEAFNFVLCGSQKFLVLLQDLR